MHRKRAIPVLLTALLVAGCGGGGPKAPPGVSQSVFERQLADAQKVSVADFPPADGKTLQELANTVEPGNQIGLAASVFVPGENRLAFGVIDGANRFVYGKTVVYVGRSAGSRAEGPFPAPADSLVTEPRYRSKQAALESSPIAAIYAAKVTFKRPGPYAVLVITKHGDRLVAATTQVRVRRSSAIPAVGERAPAVSTDTVAGAVTEESIDTRIPPAPELHQKSFKEVVGKQPIALLFATPQLCQSRVCGPVVDVELQMRSKYGDRMTFIHQEVYVENETAKGLRRPLLEFGLQTEPWLFTIDRTGKVAARLEGSFGVAAFEDAVRAALR